MQKKILTNLLLVSLCGIILTTVALYIIQTNIAYTAANEIFSARFSDIKERIKENNIQIAKLTEATKDDFLSRARALAMMIELEPQIIYDKNKLDEVVSMLNVDEVHITDENGILRWGTHPKYYGLDFSTTDQTSPFLAILEDPSLELVQDPMPNGPEGLMRQYVGVSLRNQKGIAQIGMVPERLEDALKNNSIDHLLSTIRVGNNGYIIAVDAGTGLISSHPNKQSIGTPPLHQADSGFITVDGILKLYDSKQLENQIVTAVIPAAEVFADRTFYTAVFLVFMILVFSAFCIVVNTYMRKNIICGISDTVYTLERISGGDLNVAADVRSNEEFSKLSDGINHMLSNIKAKIEEIEALANAREHLAAIVAIADAGVIIKNMNGVVLEWNIGAENILGYKPEEMIGKTTHEYAPAESWSGINDVEAQLENGGHITHSEVIRKHKDGRLIYCSASYTPLFDDTGKFDGSVAIFHDITDKKAAEQELQLAYSKIEVQNQTILSSINYASKIQRNLLPRNSIFEKTFSDYSIIWNPRDIVGGDIYWIKTFSKGTVLCVCDCTGHGTPGALLTMLVVSAFEDIINENNCHDTAQIIWLLEHRLVSVLNVTSDTLGGFTSTDIKDGCDLAVLYLSEDGTMTISSGHTHVFICNGKEVLQIKGQRIFVGEGKLNRKDDVQAITITTTPHDKFYIASDGLFDQMGGSPPRPFGYRAFKQIILNNHNEKQSVISDRIWEAFESYRDEEPRRDDFQLITFKP